MDIKGNKSGAAGALSNVTPHRFIVKDEFLDEEFVIESMEGLLQGMKFENPEEQRRIWALPWREAQEIGRQQEWWKNQTLYWRGTPMKRQSYAYQEFLDKIYRALARNQDVQKALLETGTAMLEHTIGESDPKKTVLTAEEFVSRLMWIRADLKRPSDRRTFLDF